MQAFLLLLAEKLVVKYGHDIFVSIRDWLKKREEQKIILQNEKALAVAIKSGDLDAIKKANEQALNNQP